jgi:hypothetical protein
MQRQENIEFDTLKDLLLYICSDKFIPDSDELPVDFQDNCGHDLNDRELLSVLLRKMMLVDKEKTLEIINSEFDNKGWDLWEAYLWYRAGKMLRELGLSDECDYARQMRERESVGGAIAINSDYLNELCEQLNSLTKGMEQYDD